MDTIKDLVSIIVPVYNVEEYIDKCIESIVLQTYKNIEIILVDDGSKDMSAEKCDKWEKKDKRIKIIHKNNGGLSDARNVGIEECHGDYIVFVDSDDYIEKEMIEILYDRIQKNDCDISICDFYITENNSDLEQNNYNKSEFIVEGEKKFNYLYNEYSMVTVVAWNKMYNKKIFEDIRYPVGKLHEDEFIICDILNKANKIYYIMKPLYHYVQRKSSIMATMSIRKFDIIEAFDKRVEFFKIKNDTENILKTKYHEFFRLLGLITRLYRSKTNDESTKKYIFKLKEIGQEIKECDFLSFKDRCRLKIVLVNPYLYIWIVNIVKKIMKR